MVCDVFSVVVCCRLYNSQNLWAITKGFVLHGIYDSNNQVHALIGNACLDAVLVGHVSKESRLSSALSRVDPMVSAETM